MTDQEFVVRLLGRAPVRSKAVRRVAEDRTPRRKRTPVEVDARVKVGLREDRTPLAADGNVIRDVVVIGQESVNGRRYTASALQRAINLYEGAKVFLDHKRLSTPSGMAPAQRSVKDLIARLRGVYFDGERVRGDLEMNPAHPHTAAILWVAANAPDSLGLSHNALGRGAIGDDGITVIEEIVRVESVDLVADPATTSGLFESRDAQAFHKAQQRTLAHESGLSDAEFQKRLRAPVVRLDDNRLFVASEYRGVK